MMSFVSHRYPNPDVEATRGSCRANVQEIEKKISTVEVRDESINRICNGAFCFISDQ